MAWTDVPTWTAATLEPSSTELNTYLRDNLNAQGEYPRQIWIDPTTDYDSIALFGVSVDVVTTPNYPYGIGLVGSGGPGTGGGGSDCYVIFNEYLTAGTWTINIHTSTYRDRGVLGTYVDGVRIGEFNTYTFTQVFGVLADPIEFQVTTPGIKAIKLNVEGRDINSSGGTVHIYGVMLQKTEDHNPAGIWTTPRTWSAEYVRSALLETHMRDNLRCSGPYRRRYSIDTFTVGASSGYTLVSQSNRLLGFYQDTSTINSYIEYDLVLPVGNVTITVIGEGGDNFAIATVRWDGVDRGTIDFYDVTNPRHKRGTVSFTNSTPKVAKLRITNSSKNAASSAYRLKPCRIGVGFDNSGWVDPAHLPTRQLVTVAQLNGSAWRAPMRLRAEMPWLIDIDPLAVPTVENSWSTYTKNDAWYYFCGLLNDTDAFHLPSYDGYFVEWDIPIAAGTYTCSIVAAQGTSAGQIDVLLDDVAVVSNAEFYHATAVDSKVVSTTGIVVATTKTYRVRVRINSKNASATGYSAALNRLRFRRTA